MKSWLINIPQDNKRTASAFDDVFAQLHETLRGERVAFEIIASGQTIAFGFTASETVSEVVAGEIYAKYPDAYIEERMDPLAGLNTDARFVSAEGSLRRSDLFPLRDYRDFDGDSLTALLSVLSKATPNEQILFQIVVRPERDSWLHHLRLNWRKRTSRFRQLFWVKYWFKQGIARTFQEKIFEKTSGRLFRTSVRVAVLQQGAGSAPVGRLDSVLGALASFNTLDLNQLSFRKTLRASNIGLFQRRMHIAPYLLSTRELATLFHLPNEREVPNIVHVLSRREAPPTNLPTNRRDPGVCFFGVTNFRSQRVPFGIKRSDRRRHLYVAGKSGVGKSKLLELLIRSDIMAGKGVGVLDPHGDLVDNVLKLVPKERIQDVIIFDPSDLEFPAGFNPLEQVPEALKMRVTIGFIEIFKKLFGSNWSPRLEHVLRYTTLALLDSPGTTVLSILKMLTDRTYRQEIVRGIKDNVVKNFWVNEFASWSEKFDNEAITPLLNKVGQFVATNMIRNIVGQPVNLFDFREIIDTKKILLMKVPKGILGDENAALLGAIAVTKVYQAAMARADISEDKREDFYFYVDEFQNFATATFGEILSEARKYHLNLTIANQFLGQLDDQTRRTVFGNVGSVITFRLGGEDAGTIASEFTPRFSEQDIINLGIRDFCVKMSIDGEVKDAFSGRTLDAEIPKKHYAAECIEHSRAHYARPLAEVTRVLERWEDGGRQAVPAPSGFEEPII